MDPSTNRLQVNAEVCCANEAFLKGTLFLMCLLVLCLLFAFDLLTLREVGFYLLWAASVAFLLVGRNEDYDLMHPVRILGALWCFCLGLGSLHLLSIISVWSFLMWACVLTGLATFVAGFWIATKMWGHNGSATISNLELSRSSHLLPDGKSLICAAICVAIGVSVLAYEDFLIGGIPIFADNADSLRFELFGGAAANPKFDTLFIKSIHPFVEFIKYGVFLAFIVLFQKKKKSRKVLYACWAIILFGTLAYGSQAGRTFFVTIALGGIILFHYLRRRIRLSEVTIAVLCLFLFVGLFGSARVRQSQGAPLFQKALANSAFPEGPFWESVAFGYATTTISFEVFYRFTEDLKTMAHPPGGYLFYSLHRFLPRTSLGEVANDLYSGESTTATFLGDFYGDYGYWGVFFGPLVMGLGYGWAYTRVGGEHALYWIYVRAMLLQMLVFFAYVNLFSLYLTWVFDLICMYGLLKFTESRYRQTELALSHPATA